MEIKCQKCGYEWDTSSKMDKVTCPNCGYKTPRIEKGERSTQETGELPKEQVTSPTPQTQTNKRQEEVRILNNTTAGVIALVIVVAVGAYAGSMYLGGQEEPVDTGPEPSWNSSTVFAGPVTSENSHIENVYFMQNGTGYNLNNDLNGNGNIIERNATDVIMTGPGSFTENLPYGENFDFVVAVRSDDNRLAYVDRDNVKVELGVTGAFSVGPENLTGNQLEVFEGTEGTSSYLRINAQWDNGGTGYVMQADETINITVKLWQYY